MPAVHPAQPTVRRMGRYALYRKIASGGMATLYFGRLLGHSGFARTVAVKLLHPQFAQDPEFSAMFLDEARLASRIRSPYVVPTLDVVSEDGELAIVMEYVHGESLATLARSTFDTDAARGSPVPAHVPVAVAVSVLVDALRGLQAAHEARGEDGAPLAIVHRDVSPQNILVGADGLTHLIDFGVAKATGRLQTTREGQLKGKLAYMAPEQLRGEPVTRRSDLYAASVVLWETLVGKRLFRADDEGATVTRVLLGEVEAPSKAARDDRDPAEVQAIERLDVVVMRGLDRDPAKRFETAHDMAVALERCVAPANAADVARWLEQAAGPAMARRAAAIAAIEGGVADGSTSEAMQAGVVDGQVQPTADASSISVVSGVTAGASSVRRRRARWLLAAGVLTSAIVTAGRVAWRGTGAARSPVETAQHAVTSPVTSSASGSAASNPAEPPDSVASSAAASSGAPAPSTVASPPGAPAPSTVASPPKRRPAPPRAADCNPPFSWDDQGKKHYKRECL